VQLFALDDKSIFLVDHSALKYSALVVSY